jgi:hypothetical protein
VAAALYSVTSVEGLDAPWSYLAGRVEHLSIETTLLGGVYIAHGKLACKC